MGFGSDTLMLMADHGESRWKRGEEDDGSEKERIRHTQLQAARMKQRE
jgi:hypothetical protein